MKVIVHYWIDGDHWEILPFEEHKNEWHQKPPRSSWPIVELPQDLVDRYNKAKEDLRAADGEIRALVKEST